MQSYARSLPLQEAMREDVLLAYEVNGVPLPPQHGFPLRLLVPGWYGMTSVKWLGRISLLDTPFDGYQMRHSYRLRQEEDEVGEPLARIQVRALMVPPGIPEFRTRERTVARGECVIEGRAWSGEAEVSGVEVSTDGGETWSEAELAPRVGRALGLARLAILVECRARRVRALLSRARRGRERAAARAAVECGRVREQCGAARAGDRDA